MSRFRRLEKPITKAEWVLVSPAAGIWVVLLLPDRDDLLLLAESHPWSLLCTLDELFPGVLTCAADWNDCGGKFITAELTHKAVDLARSELPLELDADLIVDENVDVTPSLGPYFGLPASILPEVLGEVVLELFLALVPLFGLPLFDQSDDVGSTAKHESTVTFQRYISMSSFGVD